jgi:beta-glucanase (GH16 family)
MGERTVNLGRQGLLSGAVGRRSAALALGSAVAVVLGACVLPGPGGLGAGTTTTTTAAPTTTTTASTTTTSTTTTTTTGSTTTTSTIPPPTCGGEETLVADGTTWDCTFDSEFTGNTLDTTKWTPIVTSAGGFTSGDVACFVNTPDNIAVGNGYLSLTAREEAAPFVCNDPYGNFMTQYTSGSVATVGLFSQTYGRVEVMAKVPSTSVPGLQSSFWLYPESAASAPVTTQAEIDIAETFSNEPGLAIPYLHYQPDMLNESAATNTNIVTKNTCTINPDQFNDYVVEWSQSTITIIYNGTTCLIDHYDETLTPPGTPFNQPLFINLTQALGIGNDNFDPATTPLPATTEIEYVRAWQAAS